jgi:hypothetical protein
MIYDRTPNNGRDGQWHCPFSPEWVERMRRAAKYCETLSAEYIARRISNEEYIYQVPDGDFLSQPQDSRGLPVWYNDDIIISRLPISCDVYDYSTIPDVVVTNGREDWPLCLRGSMLMA